MGEFTCNVLGICGFEKTISYSFKFQKQVTVLVNEQYCLLSMSTDRQNNRCQPKLKLTQNLSKIMHPTMIQNIK